jgi:hypothetical protein
MYYL